MEVDEVELDRLVQECSLYLLNRHINDAPIERTDIIKTVMSRASRKTQNEVLKKAKQVLRNVHGMNMLELKGNVESYILINVVPTSDHVELHSDVEEKKKKILLFLVLSVIYMNGDSIRESELEAFLRRLEITSSKSTITPDFSDVYPILKEEFIQQRYLAYEVIRAAGVQGNAEMVHVLYWGPRALNEVSKEKVLQYVCQVFDCSMTDFAEQFAKSINNTTHG